MKKSEIREKHKLIVKHVHEAAIENFNKDGHIYAIVFLITYDGKFMPIIAPDVDFSNYKEKLKFSNTIRQLSTKFKAVGVIFVTEAWVLSSNTKKGIPFENFSKEIQRIGGISKHPDKKEVIIIVEQYLDGTFTTSHEIIREKKKVKIKKGETVRIDDVDGIFINLLNKPDIDKLFEEVIKRND